MADNNAIQFPREALEKRMAKLKRRLGRITNFVSLYKNNETNLSADGHWSHGYYVGLQSELCNQIEDLEELLGVEVHDEEDSDR